MQVKNVISQSYITRKPSLLLFYEKQDWPHTGLEIHIFNKKDIRSYILIKGPCYQINIFMKGIYFSDKEWLYLFSVKKYLYNYLCQALLLSSFLMCVQVYFEEHLSIYLIVLFLCNRYVLKCGHLNFFHFFQFILMCIAAFKNVFYVYCMAAKI